MRIQKLIFAFARAKMENGGTKEDTADDSGVTTKGMQSAGRTQDTRGEASAVLALAWRHARHRNGAHHVSQVA